MPCVLLFVFFWIFEFIVESFKIIGTWHLLVFVFLALKCVFVPCLVLVHWNVFLFFAWLHCIIVCLCSLFGFQPSCLSCHGSCSPLKISCINTCLVTKSQKGMVLLVAIIQIMIMFFFMFFLLWNLLWNVIVSLWT